MFHPILIASGALGAALVASLPLIGLASALYLTPPSPPTDHELLAELLALGGDDAP